MCILARTYVARAILIKHTIRHYFLPKYEKDCIQATTVRVCTLPYDLAIAAVYCPCKHNIKKEDFVKVKKLVAKKKKSAILMIEHSTNA